VHGRKSVAGHGWRLQALASTVTLMAGNQGNVYSNNPNGGGNGVVNGSLLVANLYDSSGNALSFSSTPGVPSLNWNGGGVLRGDLSGVRYDLRVTLKTRVPDVWRTVDIQQAQPTAPFSRAFGARITVLEAESISHSLYRAPAPPPLTCTFPLHVHTARIPLLQTS
jgi:hypothetical protein